MRRQAPVIVSVLPLMLFDVCASANAALVSYWPFEEGVDEAGQVTHDMVDPQNGNNGTLGAGVTRVPGLVGVSALSFDNTNSAFVDAGPGVNNSFSTTTGVSVEALIVPQWSGDFGDYDEVFRKEDGGNRILLSFQNDSNNGAATPAVSPGPVLSFALNVGGLYQELDMPLGVDLGGLAGGTAGSGTIYLDDPGGTLGSNDVVLKDGGFHHVVATYDDNSGDKSIYVNGALRWTTTTPGSGITSGGGASATIGNAVPSGGEPFDGVIDEVAFYSHALTAQDISDHYSNVTSGAGVNYFGEAPPTPPEQPQPPGTSIFANVTATKNLADYRSTAGDLHAPGGVFADLNGDSYPDLYLVRNDAERNQLYLNVPDGLGGRTYEQQFGALGAVNDTGATIGDTVGVSGAIAADYDNDGDADLYVTNFGGTNRLYQNQLSESGSLSFVDVTDTAGVSGLSGSPHTLSAAWADPDRDGDLDLYVGNHDRWGTPFNGEQDVFYINNGDGTFTDATFSTPGDNLTGFQNSTGGPGVPGQTYSSTNGVIFADINNDRWVDLLVTNKTVKALDRDMLYIKQGADAEGNWLGYRTVTYAPEMSNAGSFGANPAPSAMGVNVADIDHDGDLDIFITDNPNGFAEGVNDLLINQLVETGTLSFLRRNTGVNSGLSWGAQMEDFDNDGDVEIHVTNDPANAGGLRDALFLFDDPNDPLNTTIFDVAAVAGSTNENTNARGNLAADYNRDGMLDLFVVNLNNDPRYDFTDVPSVLYENISDNENRFLNIKLIGNPLHPTEEGFATSLDAIGSRVVLMADVDGDEELEMLMREVVSGSSNAASTSSLELEFGLGLADEAMVTIWWADGRNTDLGLVFANQFIEINQRLAGDYNGDGIVNLADYSVWRDSLGAVMATAYQGADGDGSGVIDQTDYAVWRNHFGMTLADFASSSLVSPQAVPEPLSAVTATLAALVMLVELRRRRCRDEQCRINHLTGRKKGKLLVPIP